MRLSTPIVSAAIFAVLGFFGAKAENSIVLMTAADLQQQIVGNTMAGSYGDGEDWREYFDPGGEIHGEDEKHGLYTARYQLTENGMCFDYSWEDADWCGGMSINGDELTFYQDGEKVTGISHTKVLPGNPYGL